MDFYDQGVRDGRAAHDNADSYRFDSARLQPKSYNQDYLRGFAAGWNEREQPRLQNTWAKT